MVPLSLVLCLRSTLVKSHFQFPFIKESLDYKKLCTARWLVEAEWMASVLQQGLLPFWQVKKIFEMVPIGFLTGNTIGSDTFAPVSVNTFAPVSVNTFAPTVIPLHRCQLIPLHRRINTFAPVRLFTFKMLFYKGNIGRVGVFYLAMLHCLLELNYKGYCTLLGVHHHCLRNCFSARYFLTDR